MARPRLDLAPFCIVNCAALHALAHGARRENAVRHRRAGTRLVPDQLYEHFSDWADLIHGPPAECGQLSCPCHPNCGIGMALMIDKETKEAAPVTAFLDMGQVAKDLAKVNDAARGKWLSVIGLGLSLMRNYDPFKAPTHFKITDMMKKMDKTFNATGKNYGSVKGDRTIDDIEKRRRIAGTSCSSRGCGSRICSTTTSGARSSASFLTLRRKANQLLRVQHGRGLAEHHREDAHDGDSDQVV